MRIKFLGVLLILAMSTTYAWAIKGVIASEENIARLKQDLRDGAIKIGQTRLKEIRERYGEAANITSDEKRITYNYGDLSIVFDKKKYWKKWEYDSFRDPVFTDSVDDLRFDLESKELVGENITFKKIRRDYDEPTFSEETTEDGGTSSYYWGDIKLIFENYIVIQSWRGSNLESEASPEGVLSGS